MFRAERALLTVTREDLTALEPEWRELLASCSSHASIFQSPTWLRTWWGEFGADRELVLLSVRDEQRLVGVVPLMREGGRLSFAGDTEVTDYMDFPCTSGRESELLGTDAIERREVAAENMVEALDDARTLQRPQIADLFNHADFAGVAARISTDGAGLHRIQIAALLTAGDFARRIRQGIDQRLQQSFLAFDQMQCRTARRTRPEAR